MSSSFKARTIITVVDLDKSIKRSALEVPAGIVDHNTNYRTGGGSLIYFHHHADIAGADLNQTPPPDKTAILETKALTGRGSRYTPVMRSSMFRA